MSTATHLADAPPPAPPPALGPAEIARCHDRGYPFGERIPARVRVLRTVRSSKILTMGGSPELVAEPGEFPAWTNIFGAVSAVLPGGQKLGLLPEEFEVAEWRVPDHPRPVRERGPGPAQRFSSEQEAAMLRLYVEQKKTLQFIGDQYGLSKVGVAGILDRYGIPRRRSGT